MTKKSNDRTSRWRGELRKFELELDGRTHQHGLKRWIEWLAGQREVRAGWLVGAHSVLSLGLPGFYILLHKQSVARCCDTPFCWVTLSMFSVRQSTVVFSYSCSVIDERMAIDRQVCQRKSLHPSRTVYIWDIYDLWNRLKATEHCHT